MKTVKTNNGWVETVVTEHKIKVVKAIMLVSDWIRFNDKNPQIGAKRQHCERCKTLWTALPPEGNINLAMMVNEVNRAICDKCMTEIDQSLIIK